jgi:enoyl-CoA hydratase
MTALLQTAPVDYVHDAGVATITMDDGKVNVMSMAMIGAIHDALDRAQGDGAIVILAGRDGVFSAGFDLAALRAGAFASSSMVRAGFELAARVLEFPRPVISACTGHAIAMGAFLLCSTDVRIGAQGDFRFAANEVAIGLTVPHAAISLLRARLVPSAFERAVVLAEPFTPLNAVDAGFLDRVVAPHDVLAVAQEVASSTAMLDADAVAATKRRSREATIRAVRDGIAFEFDDFRPR